MEAEPQSRASGQHSIARLLSGLLSNVGNKTESMEYADQQVRASSFSSFPGSSLFSKKPQWVMAAELVETTRLYARTVAKVAPQWIERAAQHLIKRTYTDPVWNPQRADVIAGEKVSLKGLVIVPHRNVSYGPIDPRTSREIFIHHALVEGDFRTNGEFIRYNQNLIRQVQMLENKARRARSIGGAAAAIYVLPRPRAGRCLQRISL